MMSCIIVELGTKGSALCGDDPLLDTASHAHLAGAVDCWIKGAKEGPPLSWDLHGVEMTKSNEGKTIKVTWRNKGWPKYNAFAMTEVSYGPSSQLGNYNQHTRLACFVHT